MEQRIAETSGVADETGHAMAGAMADLLNLAMLVCAAIGSMAFGILAAYGVLRVGFALMRPQRRPAEAKTRPEVARVV